MRFSDQLVFHRRVCVSRDGRIPPVAVVATLAGCRPVREYALAVADGFADRRARGLHLRPDSADQRLRRLRSEEHTSELQSLMRTSYAVFCLKQKKKVQYNNNIQ